MTDLDITPRALEPIVQFTLNHDDPQHMRALRRVLATAMEAYGIRHHYALHHEEQSETTAHEEALLAAIAVAGRAYAAAALSRAAAVLGARLDEEAFTALGDTAAALDLEVIEDLEGANG